MERKQSSERVWEDSSNEVGHNQMGMGWSKIWSCIASGRGAEGCEKNPNIKGRRIQTHSTQWWPQYSGGHTRAGRTRPNATR